MTKSKALEIIACWAKPEILNDVYSNNYAEWAKNLLDVLENEIGMIPPERVRYTDMENGNTLCSPECSWEEEDEL